MFAAKAVLIFCIFKFSNAVTVQDIVDLISTGQQQAQNYVLPTDARKFEPVYSTIRDYGTVFDFIIIGASPSGSVLARRLADLRRFKVLLIEAGKFSDQSYVQFPRLWATQAFSDYNWGYTTTPQYSACLKNVNRTCRYDSGKGVGGSSIIGQVVYSRGNPENFNSWATKLYDSTWSYQNLLPLFKKTENFHYTSPRATIDTNSHGYSGLLHVQHRLPTDYIFNDVFLDANLELGYPISDPNGPNPIGGHIVQLYTKNGTREDMGTVFVSPVANSQYLTVLTESYVTKIEINSAKVVEGVIFSRGGSYYRVKAANEVILSAGGIGSPRILMSSGVGPRRHLEEVGIELVQDLEVGSAFKDYANAALIFSTNVTRPVDSWTDWAQDYLYGQGDLTGVTRVQAGGYYPLGNDTSFSNLPNIRIASEIALRSAAAEQYRDYTAEIEAASWGSNVNAISFLVGLLNPKSSGTIRLKSNNPFDYPLINPKLLSDLYDEDIATMYEGINFIFKMKDTKAYRRLNTTYGGGPLPPCTNLDFMSKDYWYCYLRTLTTLGGYPVGACPMGISKWRGAVVDSNLKVLGVSKLRIADESVFPTPVSGHPSIQATVVGEKLADILRYQY